MFRPTSLTTADEIQKLTECFRGIEAGNVVTFEAMQKVLGFDVRERRHLITRARRALNREIGVVFASMAGVGYRRVPADEVYMIGTRARGSVRRTTRTASRSILRAVEHSNELDLTARRRAFGEVSALQLLEHLSADRVTQSLPAMERPISVAATWAAMVTLLGISLPSAT